MQKNTGRHSEPAKKPPGKIVQFSDPPASAQGFVRAWGAAGPRSFALVVRGDSMVPEFREGDIVIVDPDREVESGSFVVAQNTLGQATIKQLIKDDRGVFLRPLNSAYPVMDVTGQELPFMGRVVEKQKRY